MKPMLALPAYAGDVFMVIDSPEWVLEPKLDGRRLIIDISDGRIQAFGRDGQLVDNRSVALLSKMTAHRSWDISLDGELIDGEFWGFDLPRVSTAITRGSPWSERRNALEVLDGLFDSYGYAFLNLVPAARTLEEKERLIERVTAEHGEGWVAKKIDAPYEPGKRSHNWLKLCLRHRVDCFVISVDAHKASMTLGLLDGDKVIEVGRCTRLSGEGRLARPGDVVSVDYKYATTARRLYQPTSPLLRTDKTASECDVGQLHYGGSKRPITRKEMDAH